MIDEGRVESKAGIMCNDRLRRNWLKDDDKGASGYGEMKIN